jgi:hypothetical protein
MTVDNFDFYDWPSLPLSVFFVRNVENNTTLLAEQHIKGAGN